MNKYEFKQRLRKQILAQRNSLSPEQVATKSNSIASRLFSLPEYRQATSVMAYADFRNEVRTGLILDHILAQGKKLFLPVTQVPEKRLLPAQVSDLAKDLAPGTWGITEPTENCPRLKNYHDIDLVIVPGLVFDRSGNRLGYGGGFYDRFLPQVKKEAVLVALAFEMQMKKQIHPGYYDVSMDLLITERRILNFHKI